MMNKEAFKQKLKDTMSGIGRGLLKHHEVAFPLIGSAGMGGGLYGVGKLTTSNPSDEMKKNIVENTYWGHGYRKKDSEFKKKFKNMQAGGANKTQLGKALLQHQKDLDTEMNKAVASHKKWAPLIMGGAGALEGALLGGLVSHELSSKGFSGKRFKDYYAGGNFGGPTSGASLKKAKDYFNMGSVKTKEDAKKIFRQHAKQNHPDMGGSHEKMQEINKHWEDIQNSNWFKKLGGLRRGFFGI